MTREYKAQWQRDNADQRREKYAANKDAINEKSRAKRYGLTLGELRELTAKYAGCWICGRTRRMAVDHCHTTGIRRGILCIKCNVGIASLSDTVEGLEAALTYLESNDAQLILQGIEHGESGRT